MNEYSRSDMVDKEQSIIDSMIESQVTLINATNIAIDDFRNMFPNEEAFQQFKDTIILLGDICKTVHTCINKTYEPEVKYCSSIAHILAKCLFMLVSGTLSNPDFIYEAFNVISSLDPSKATNPVNNSIKELLQSIDLEATIH